MIYKVIANQIEELQSKNFFKYSRLKLFSLNLLYVLFRQQNTDCDVE